MQIQFSYKYEIGSYVYHNTPESDKGLVIDISYSILSRLISYKVTFGRGSDDEIWCFEHELNESKTF